MAFVAPSDLVAFAQEDNELAESSLATFLACPTGDAKSCNVGLAREASPATHLDAAAPPAYFAYGSTDAIAPPITQGLPIALQWAAARNEALSTAPNALVSARIPSSTPMSGLAPGSVGGVSRGMAVVAFMMS